MKKAISSLSKIYHVHEKYAANYIKASDELGTSSQYLNCALQHMKIACYYRCLAQSLSEDKKRGHITRILYIRKKIKDLSIRIQEHCKTDKQVLGEAFSEIRGSTEELLVTGPARKLKLRPNG